MKHTTIARIAKGEFFRFIDSDTAPVWVRGHYDRSSGKYSCTKADDMNHEKFKLGGCPVYIGFTY